MIYTSGRGEKANLHARVAEGDEAPERLSDKCGPAVGAVVVVRRARARVLQPGRPALGRTGGPWTSAS